MYKAGYDPELVRGVLRKGRGGRKETAGHDPEGFLDAPADAGPHRGHRKRKLRRFCRRAQQYIVTTSEFDSVKHRLQMIEANVKVKDKNPNKPTLRKRTAQNKGGDTLDGYDFDDAIPDERVGSDFER